MWFWAILAGIVAILIFLAWYFRGIKVYPNAVLLDPTEVQLVDVDQPKAFAMLPHLKLCAVDWQVVRAETLIYGFPDNVRRKIQGEFESMINQAFESGVLCKHLRSLLRLERLGLYLLVSPSLDVCIFLLSGEEPVYLYFDVEKKGVRRQEYRKVRFIGKKLSTTVRVYGDDYSEVWICMPALFKEVWVEQEKAVAAQRHLFESLYSSLSSLMEFISRAAEADKYETLSDLYKKSWEEERKLTQELLKTLREMRARYNAMYQIVAMIAGLKPGDRVPPDMIKVASEIAGLERKFPISLPKLGKEESVEEELAKKITAPPPIEEKKEEKGLKEKFRGIFK